MNSISFSVVSTYRARGQKKDLKKKTWLRRINRNRLGFFRYFIFVIAMQLSDNYHDDAILRKKQARTINPQSSHDESFSRITRIRYSSRKDRSSSAFFIVRPLFRPLLSSFRVVLMSRCRFLFSFRITPRVHSPFARAGYEQVSRGSLLVGHRLDRPGRIFGFFFFSFFFSYLRAYFEFSSLLHSRHLPYFSPHV